MPGYPRFRSGRRWKTIEIAQPTAAMITNRHGKWVVKVKGLPILVIKPQRELPDSTHLKTLTITRKPKGVYVGLGLRGGEGSTPEDGAVGRPGHGCALSHRILRRLFRRPPTTRKRQGGDAPEADCPVQARLWKSAQAIPPTCEAATSKLHAESQRVPQDNHSDCSQL